MRHGGGRTLGRVALATATALALCLVGGAAAAGPQTYNDPVDTNPGPDVTLVTVSNDSSGVVSVRIDLANRPNGLTAGDNIYMYVNTDRDTSTGCAGSEYRIFAFGSPLQFGVDPCVNGAFTETGACCGSFSNGGITFTIPPDRIGHSTNFWFWVATAVNGNFGPPQGDYVPDSDPSGSPLQYDAGATLTITLDGTGTGSVTSPARSLECDASCSATFATGTSVTLTAHPEQGSTFAGWSGDCSGTGTCTVTMSEDRSVSATFTKRPRHGKKHMRATIGQPPRNVFHIQGQDVTWFKSFAVVKAPPGARVVFRCSRCRPQKETTRANAAGRARSRIVSGGIGGTQRFHSGDLITVGLTKKAYFGCTLRVRMKVGDFQLTRRC